MESPVIREVRQHDVGSAVAVAGHPIHAMAVAFPIALSLATLAADLMFWWSADQFWSRAGLWAGGAAFLLGIFAGLAGTAELLLVRGIRQRAASWAHAVAAMMLLAVAGLNWGARLEGGAAAVLPFGLCLSLLGAVFVGLAGWHGGKLVFHHGIGTIASVRD